GATAHVRRHGWVLRRARSAAGGNRPLWNALFPREPPYHRDWRAYGSWRNSWTGAGDGDARELCDSRSGTGGRAAAHLSRVTSAQVHAVSNVALRPGELYHRH